MRDKLKPLRNHSPKLFTASIDKMLFKQYPMGNDLSKQMVVAKIVNPFGFGNWYLLNSDPNDPDYIWAIVDYEILDVEIGSVSRKELENEKLYSYNGDETTLQRDLNFTPVNAKKLYNGLLKGKYYAHGGTTKRPLHVIAAEIRADWKNVYFGAKPYLDAMSTMNSIDDNYGMDDGRSIVNYFLANASTWRGETAKRVKAELKEMAKYSHGGRIKIKFSRGGISGESARVKNLSDEFASEELKEKLRKAIGIEGDVIQETDTPVIAFGFTDYGGDFYDKIAIAYFSEYYPDNTLVEPTAYSGYNAFVYGKPAQDYIEQTENYLLGFEDMETLYYEAQLHEEEQAFDDFIKDLNDEKYLFDEDMVKDWLMQNRTGYYSMTTTGLDYSSSELTDALLQQGLLIEDFGILLEDLSNDGYVYDDDELEQYIRENIEGFIALAPFDMYYEDIVSILLKDGIISEEENYAKGGKVIQINNLYKKSNFINDNYDWEYKLLEMIQDQSIEAYNIYQQLTPKEKEQVLEAQWGLDNDMGGDGDGTLSTTEENLHILLKGAKGGKYYAKGGKVNIIEGQDLGWEWKHENQELFRLFYDEAKTDYNMFYQKALKSGYSKQEIDEWYQKRNINNTYDKGGSFNKAEWAAVFMNKKEPYKFIQVLIHANSIVEAIQQALMGALVYNMNKDYNLVDVYVVKGGRRTDTNYSKGAGYAKGGKLGFKGLSEKVAKRYEGQKVAPKYQKEYGKTYDKAEAQEVGKKVAAKVYRAQLSNKKSVSGTKTK
jgi:hypothetical protein